MVISFLSDPIGRVLVAAGVGFVLFGFLALVFTSEYERGGRSAVHRRPRKMEPWHVEPVRGLTQSPARHRASDMYGMTTMIGPSLERIRRGNHTRPQGRLRQTQEIDGQEESRKDRERWQDESRAFRYGEEGRSYPTSQVGERTIRWHHAAITGEIIIDDEEERYPS